MQIESRKKISADIALLVWKTSPQSPATPSRCRGRKEKVDPTGDKGKKGLDPTTSRGCATASDSRRATSPPQREVQKPLTPGGKRRGKSTAAEAVAQAQRKAACVPRRDSMNRAGENVIYPTGQKMFAPLTTKENSRAGKGRPAAVLLRKGTEEDRGG